MRQASAPAHRSTALRSVPREVAVRDQADSPVLRPTEGLVSNKAFTLPGSSRAIEAYRQNMDSRIVADPLYIDTYA